LLLRHRRLSIGPIAWPVAAYFAVGIVSSILSWRGSSASTSFLQMFLFLVVVIQLFASLTPRPEDVKPALVALLGVAMFFATVLLVTRQQYVLGIHKNGIGGSMGVSFLVCLELLLAERVAWRRWALSATLAVIAAGLLITLSRGAWLGTALGTMLIFAMRRQWILMGRAVAVLVPIMFVAWNSLPKDQRDYATSFDKKRGNIEARYENLEFMQRNYAQNPLLGVGVGLRKQADATNLVWMTLAETGILGLISLAAIHVAFFGMIWRTQARLESGDPLFSLVAIGGALILARLAHGMVDHYWARGPTMMGWAGAGMATGAYFALQTRAVVARHAPQTKALIALAVIETERRRRAERSEPRNEQLGAAST
jgi:O-antigen ligase